MVSVTKKALDGPNSSLAQIKDDVKALLKTTTKAFDSVTKALSLSTSSLLDGIANLKLDEAVPQSKGGEKHGEVSKQSPEKEKINPEIVINLEKTLPAGGDGEEKETPPAVGGDE